MKKLVCIILTISIIFIYGCSNNNQTLINENEQLKSKVLKLEQEINNKNNKITETQNKGVSDLSIDYIQNKSNKSFVENKCDLLAMPLDDSIKLNTVLENTVITVLDTANVNGVTWLYAAIPVYDSPTNYKGWLKESDTVLYTKDKISQVQSDVKVKVGVDIYETEKFENIKSAKPYKSDGLEHGRILVNQNGYVNIQSAGGKTIWIKDTSVIYPELG